MRRADVLKALAAAAVIGGTLLACRAAGFGEGLLLGATPASGVALAAAVLLRGPGVLAVGLGYAFGGLAAGLAPETAAVDALAHGLAALVAALFMRQLACRRAQRSKSSDWFIFLGGTTVFTTIVAVTGLATYRVVSPGHDLAPIEAAVLSLAFEPLGLLTFGAVAFSLQELALVRADPKPAYGIATLALALLATFWLVLTRLGPGLDPSGLTVTLAVPLCLWVAMQRRSLDGAALSFVAALAALGLLLQDLGSILHPEYVTAIVYVTLLVVVCQLVHAVNRDRLAALADVEARVEKRTARLRAMTERALAGDAAKTRFLATVSHEVRTPLNGVLGMTSVVLASRLDPQTRRNVEIIRTSGLHLLDVINRILDYAQMEEGRAAERPAPFDLRALAEEVLAEARFLPYADGVALRLSMPPDLVPGRLGHRQSLRQVLTNLVGNAAKFTERGHIQLAIAPAGEDWLRIEVQDTGIGIPPEDHARIFLPFEQSEASTARRKGGTGLGLAIVAEAVRRMKGRIGLASVPGEGSTFWIELPLPVATTPADTRAEAFADTA